MRSAPPPAARPVQPAVTQAAAKAFPMTAMDAAQVRAKIDQQSPVESATFFDFDWHDFDGEGARFIDCHFVEAQFGGTNFGSATFARCHFIRCRFSHADLRDTAFNECQFLDRADTTGCIFTFSDLRQARFLKCDLSLCEIDRSDLFSIEMDACNLRGARLHRIDFSHAYSRKVVRTRATFRGCNLELVDLAEVRMAECDLTASRFREADLSAADLTGAVLRDCDLFKTVLTGAKLEGADLRGAEISGLSLMELASFHRMKVYQSQQHILLAGIGVDVYPEPGAT
jgi:fluoroquinolone resistance protein